MKKYKVICKQGKEVKKEVILCNSHNSLIDRLGYVLLSGKFCFDEIHVDFTKKIPLLFIELKEK